MSEDAHVIEWGWKGALGKLPWWLRAFLWPIRFMVKRNINKLKELLSDL